MPVAQVLQEFGDFPKRQCKEQVTPVVALCGSLVGLLFRFTRRGFRPDGEAREQPHVDGKVGLDRLGDDPFLAEDRLASVAGTDGVDADTRNSDGLGIQADDARCQGPRRA